MLPIPAITCWSSSSAFIGWRLRPAASARRRSTGDRPPSGSTPRSASSGSSTAALSGSNTTTSPNVRGSTNRSSSPPVAKVSTTWVCWAGARRLGRSATGRSSAGGPSAVARVERHEQVLAVRWPASSTVAPGQAVDHRLGATCAARCAPVRPRRASILPADQRSVEAAPTVSTSGSSGTEPAGRRRLSRRLDASRAAACSACFFDRPSPSPRASPPTHTVAKNRLA